MRNLNEARFNRLESQTQILRVSNPDEYPLYSKCTPTVSMVSARTAGTLHLFRLLTPKYLQFFSCRFQHQSRCSTVLQSSQPGTFYSRQLLLVAEAPFLRKQLQSKHLNHLGQQRQEATRPAAPSCHQGLPCPGHCPPTGCHPATTVPSAASFPR